MTPRYHNHEIIQATTELDKKKCMDVRYQVFIIEQKYPAYIEVDEPFDPVADHFLLVANSVDDDSQGEKVPVGTVRMNTSGNVAVLSRLAVMSDARGCSYGKILVQAVIECAKARGLEAVTLKAQHFKVDFYKHLGFHIDDEQVFYRYDVAHYHMRISL
ncbi:acyl-CoA N-acyltransferase [Lichtheimia hyalospora FSU 10163]|nr:acyl-CoA N-acyltransferase [Lichtheimia hyalospora FSU 10163]